ncbi:phospho-N-acetylmuramoyl-pentapeptide-transferase [Calorimonas adulescens]|uniref:Phospho-N-acetylmuramoyl-pentapeptide-transferase n=1 Tax=Calorimonas adulescens TaxID=2606906 RepID=A0A5D8QCV7_9THEO|nr:phospho-N-acetylmuramoyl-pentapeptide-transferase [Calorimonas adulescens]TZE81949.1 phospho-N-acetylmuramoyl-pentapeptide-transferase [Calorimonas adulescens]
MGQFFSSIFSDSLFVNLMLITVLSFMLSIFIAPPIIEQMGRLKYGQEVREDGPKTHLAKSGTPTMGGIIFIISSVLVSLFLIPNSMDKWALILLTLSFAFIGFLDDYLKVVRKKSLGLKAREKLILQFVISFIFAYYVYITHGSEIYIPFLKFYVDIGVYFIPFIVFVVVGTVNSVNLTDGLDGLAAGVTFIVSAFFTLSGLMTGNIATMLFGSSITGSVLGFLRYNIYPAEIFMGDTGSLALGGAVAGMAVIADMPLILPIVGGIYVIEAASVIIQVLFFRLTGKRIFKMSPLHHHFEMLGWHETKVVNLFIIITLILSVIGLISLY